MMLTNKFYRLTVLPMHLDRAKYQADSMNNFFTLESCL